VTSFGLYIKANKENCGLEGLVYIDSMAILLKEYINHKYERTTKGFVQLGHDIEPIIGSAFPSFGFGRRNSAGQ
jgi:hypothetical protein